MRLALSATGIGLFTLLLVIAPALAPASSPQRLIYSEAKVAASAAVPAVARAQGLGIDGGPTLGISASPSSLCVYPVLTCLAGTNLSRVTLWANAGSTAQISWPKVQVAFVIETTPLDGVYDSVHYKNPGYVCKAVQGLPAQQPCEESDGVPVFIVHATQIAKAIQAENPHTEVTFAMIDYYATNDQWDGGGGSVYRVDIGSFVSAGELGADVAGTFQTHVLAGGFTYIYSGFQNNFLHSSMISALYGTLTGSSGLAWAPDTHHVVIWVGSTAPRDPSYVENYCVSPSLILKDGTYDSCYASICEPSHAFTSGTSPLCEGWIHSPDGNSSHSIAALARTSPECVQAVGHSCTIDMIDLVNSATDPYSPDWPLKCPPGTSGCGPGNWTVMSDVTHILQAGCDMAIATGGSWNGPGWFTCKNGEQGGIQYVQHGPATNPNTNDPTLIEAFRTAAFGPIVSTRVATGTGAPLFLFMPYGAIAPAPGAELQATASCLRGTTLLPDCQLQPTIAHLAGVEYLEWNWSRNASLNEMYVGDEWTASFNIIAPGPPFAKVPVDACTTDVCKSLGSTALNGLFTRDTFIPATNDTTVTESFPVAVVNVEALPTPTPAALPPAVPTAPP
ncbi:MAG: hypothetical protein ACHQ2Y_07980, partial [Candidatus Lutacidiplasmatales archaeon]